MAYEFDEDILNRKTAIIQAMNRDGIDSIAITYSGSGDSGQIDEIALTPAKASYATYNGSDIPLRSFVEDFADELIESAHSGYENGDGGAGTITITRATATVTWEHSDFYTESDTTEYAL
jgi:hypothetical protein